MKDLFGPGAPLHAAGAPFSFLRPWPSDSWSAPLPQGENYLLKGQQVLYLFTSDTEFSEWLLFALS